MGSVPEAGDHLLPGPGSTAVSRIHPPPQVPDLPPFGLFVPPPPGLCMNSHRSSPNNTRRISCVNPTWLSVSHCGEKAPKNRPAEHSTDASQFVCTLASPGAWGSRFQCPRAGIVVKAPWWLSRVTWGENVAVFDLGPATGLTSPRASCPPPSLFGSHQASPLLVLWSFGLWFKYLLPRGALPTTPAPLYHVAIRALA